MEYITCDGTCVLEVPSTQVWRGSPRAVGGAFVLEVPSVEVFGMEYITCDGTCVLESTQVWCGSPRTVVWCCKSPAP